MKIIHCRSEVESAFHEAFRCFPVSWKSLGGLSESQFILRTPLLGWPNVSRPFQSSVVLRWLATWLYCGIWLAVLPSFLVVIDFLFMDFSVLLLQVPLVLLAWAYLAVGFGAVDSEKYVIIIPRFLFFLPLSWACHHELRHVAKGDLN